MLAYRRILKALTATRGRRWHRLGRREGFHKHSTLSGSQLVPQILLRSRLLLVSRWFSLDCVSAFQLSDFFKNRTLGPSKIRFEESVRIESFEILIFFAKRSRQFYFGRYRANFTWTVFDWFARCFRYSLGDFL